MDTVKFHLGTTLLLGEDETASNGHKLLLCYTFDVPTKRRQTGTIKRFIVYLLLWGTHASSTEKPRQLPKGDRQGLYIDFRKTNH